jgi:hypothetical protein
VPKITGGSVLSLQTFVTRTYGDGAFARVLDHMEPELGEPLRGIVLPVNWYPTPAFVRAIETASTLFADDRLFERYGAFAADFEITRFQRFALRFTSPLYLMSRAGRMWNRFHDTGEWNVTGGANELRGALKGFAIVSESYCRVLTAWIHRAAEMTGVRGSVVHPECRARGADACLFVGTWQ